MDVKVRKKFLHVWETRKNRVAVLIPEEMDYKL